MQRTTTAVLIAALLVLAAAVGSAGMAMALTDGSADPAAAQSPGDSTDSRTITVSASGSAETDPDEAVLRLAVTVTAPDATTARNQVAENVSAIKAALADLGIEESAIRTTDYRIYRDDHPRPTEKGEEVAPVYRARHTLRVEVADVDSVGQVLDAAVDAGATDIQDVQFTLAEDTRDDLRDQALTAAMERARSQADTLASSADLTVVGVSDVSTVDFDRPVVRYETAMAASGGDTEISTGPVSVTAQVTVVYNATA
jgi:hypothetical protein